MATNNPDFLTQLFLNTSTYINIHYVSSPLGWQNLIQQGIASEGDIIIDSQCYPYGALHTQGQTFYFFNPDQYAEDLALNYYDDRYVGYVFDPKNSKYTKNAEIEGYFKSNSIITNNIKRYNTITENASIAIDVSSDGQLHFYDNALFYDQIYFKKYSDTSWYNLQDELKALLYEINKKADFTYVQEYFEYFTDIIDQQTEWIHVVEKDVKNLDVSIKKLDNKIIQSINDVYNDISAIWDVNNAQQLDITYLYQKTDDISNWCGTQISDVSSRLTSESSALYRYIDIVDNDVSNLKGNYEQYIVKNNTNISNINSSINTINAIIYRHDNDIENISNNVASNYSKITNLTSRVSKLETWKTSTNSKLSTIDSSIKKLESWKPIIDASVINLSTNKVDKTTYTTEKAELKTYIDSSIDNLKKSLTNTFNSEITALNNIYVAQSQYDNFVQSTASDINVLNASVQHLQDLIGENSSDGIIEDIHVLYQTTANLDTSLNTIFNSVGNLNSSVSDAFTRIKIHETSINLHNAIINIINASLSAITPSWVQEQVAGLYYNKPWIDTSFKAIDASINTIDAVVTGAIIDLKNDISKLQETKGITKPELDSAISEINASLNVLVEADSSLYSYIDTNDNILNENFSDLYNSLNNDVSNIEYYDDGKICNTSLGRMAQEIADLKFMLSDKASLFEWSPEKSGIVFMTQATYNAQMDKLPANKLYIITDA